MCLEITMKAFLGDYTINESPSRWRDRAAGTSGFNLGRRLPNYLVSHFVAFQPLSRNRWAREELRST
jgi:hypothetical protein